MICNRCGVYKEPDAFYKRTNGNLRKICKDCTNARKKERYREDKGLRDYIRDKTKAKRKRRIRHLAAYKVRKGCSRCGFNSHPSALEFHHPNDDKEGMVSYMINGSLRKLFTEIRKCVILCSNCHKIEHAS